MSDAELRSISELLTLYELYPDMRDVYVEGRHDVLLVSAYLRFVGSDAKVYEVNKRVKVPTGDVISKGYDDGNRGRLILLALALNERDAGSLCGTCMIDADRGYLTGDIPNVPCLVVTDYGSVEVYALNPTALDKFFSFVLRIDPQMPVAQVRTRILSALVRIFVVRHVLHSEGYGVALVDAFTASCDFSCDPVRVDVEDLFYRSLSPPKAELVRLHGKAVDLCSALAGDDRRYVRGHDIAPMLIAMFELENDWAHPETVEAALIGCVEVAELHDERAFTRLRERVCVA